MRYDINSIKKRKQNSKIIRRIIDVILIILIYNIILVSISCMNKISEINIFGYKAYTITTNSMEPTIHVEDVIIVRKCKEKDLKVGDIISFKQNNETITHRITNIEQDEDVKMYITKGDNNNIEDLQKVNFESIEGKKVITIPYLGKIMNILDNKIVFLMIILILLILCFYKIQISEKKENRREKKKIEEEKFSKN